MQSKIRNSAPSASVNRMKSFVSNPVSVARKALALEPANRALPPLGSLWDPTLLDRLQLPLTRYHE